MWKYSTCESVLWVQNPLICDGKYPISDNKEKEKLQEEYQKITTQLEQAQALTRALENERMKNQAQLDSWEQKNKENNGKGSAWSLYAWMVPL